MEGRFIGIIGLGLIGGSFAKSIKAKKLPYNIIAYDTDIHTLELAYTEKIIDDYDTSLSPKFKECQMIFLCTPVKDNLTYLKRLKALITKDCIVTDMGSVKSSIYEHIVNVQLEEQFIGGHPMAGSEKSGYRHATSLLLENAYYILSPTSKVSLAKIDQLREIVTQIGAIPIELNPYKHDYITAVISHFPHIIASSLVNLLFSSSKEDINLMKQLAAGGFKDITRIASSSPSMWEQICLENKEMILQVMNQFQEQLNLFQDALHEMNSSTIYQFFEDNRLARNSISNRSTGALPKNHEIYASVPDEPGIIAKVASVLAENRINIKNIGILHNRETEPGVLSILFYDEESLIKSVKILEDLEYNIYLR